MTLAEALTVAIVTAVESGGITASQAFFVGGTLAVAVIGAVGVIIAKRLREPTRIETLWTRLDAQDLKITTQGSLISELTTRVGRAERRGNAAVGVVRDLVRQWPHGHVPRLNPVDIDDLGDEDAIPAEWKVKP